jgi:hypothetical protein
MISYFVLCAVWMAEQLTLYMLDAVKNDRGPNRGVRMEMLKEFLLG